MNFVIVILMPEKFKILQQFYFLSMSIYSKIINNMRAVNINLTIITDNNCDAVLATVSNCNKELI